MQYELGFLYVNGRGVETNREQAVQWFRAACTNGHSGASNQLRKFYPVKLTSTDLIAAKVVEVDAANDLAFLKAEGRIAALPVVASRDACRGWVHGGHGRFP